MSKKNEPGDYGSMRRMHEAIIRSGSLGRLGSEGRLVFGIALCWADYKNCTFTMSARGAAKVACVQVNSVRRGLMQLAKAGLIEQSVKRSGGRRKFRFCLPKNPDESGSEAHTSCVRQLAHSVCAHGTAGVRGAHDPCHERTHSVPSIPQLSSRTPQGVREDGRTRTGVRVGLNEQAATEGAA
jgi:hypothetical protein